MYARPDYIQKPTKPKTNKTFMWAWNKQQTDLKPETSCF